jgi:hypothetical protein
MGRGGREHKYLQQLVKQWGDGMGYRSTIEKEILNGDGSIDVALEKSEVAIACQISVTTGSDWELANVQKILQTTFSPVFLISDQAPHLAKLQKSIAAVLDEAQRPKVHFLSSEQLFAYLQTLEVSHLKQENTIRGYKIKRSYKPLDSAETEDRRASVVRAVAASLKRVKPPR